MRRPRRVEPSHRCPRCGFEAGSEYGLAMHLKYVCGKEQGGGLLEEMAAKVFRRKKG